MIDIDKYENSTIKNLNKENIMRITEFLNKNNCDYIEELLDNYLDIFIFEYDEFILKFNKLNEKYNYKLIEKIKDDMNIIEEFYK